MFCEKIDEHLYLLKKNGAVKLPSIKHAKWRMEIYESCIKEIGKKSYGENLPSNFKFLEHANILSVLLPKLTAFAKAEFSFIPKINDVYHVCRLVRPGDLSEGYRGHFDSHLFTLVTPIYIPNFENVINGGQLHYFPNLRKQPKNEFQNILGKALHKRHNSALGFEKLAKKKPRLIDDFQDYRPLLFLGNTTYHGNAPVQSSSKENRLTILTHFFDPSPKLGVGAMLRKLRHR